jgi:predicted MFS family arabinose efflux permease
MTRKRLDIILLLISSFFYRVCAMSVIPIITQYSVSVGAGLAVTGLIGGLMSFSSLLSRPMAGYLADRQRKYKMAFIGAALMAVACIGYAMADDFAIVMVSRVLHGVGHSCCSVAMATWISTLFSKDRMGYGMGIYGTVNPLAMALAPALGIQIYRHFGYETSFLAAAFFGVVTIICIQFVSDKGEIKKLPDKDEELEFIDSDVVPIMLIIMLFAIPFCATQSYVVRYVDVLGLSVSVTLFFPAYVVFLVLTRFFMKNLFDRLSFGVFTVGGAVSTLFALLCLTYMKDNLGLIAASFFMAGGYGIMCSVALSKSILFAKPGKRGLANSTYYIGLDLGMTLGPVIGGLLMAYVPTKDFYPVLTVSIPLIFLVYFLNRRQLNRKVAQQ